jgi:hypothetical protein
LLLVLAWTASPAKEKKDVLPPACQDEEAMVADYQKSLGDLVEAVKKESLAEFQSHYHRKSCLAKLSLYVGVLGGVTECFDKASQDPKRSKDEAATYGSKRDSLAKLKTRLEGYRDGLKAASMDKDAKALIETFDLSM